MRPDINGKKLEQPTAGPHGDMVKGDREQRDAQEYVKKAHVPQIDNAKTPKETQSGKTD